ncbi:MAG TPA: hypothetical protein VFA33_07765 [Bryobacteraceae bacterium]|nr:hypothetical protein [Bryobacteraceae bacterium]
MVGKLEKKFERGAAADLWRHTLAQIPTVFGRLVYLSTLRNANSGLYEHHGLAQLFGEEEADRTLRQSHMQVFNEWLCFRLERQKADVEEYLAGLEGGPRTVLSTWIRLAPYRAVVPTNARDVEKQLYNTDLETVLELLRYDYDVASPDPEA